MKLSLGFGDLIVKFCILISFSFTALRGTIYCQKCDSTNLLKNGVLNNDKQNYRCKSCGSQFVETPRVTTEPMTRQVALWITCFWNDSPCHGLRGPLWFQSVGRRNMSITIRKYSQGDRPPEIAWKKFSQVIECEEIWSFCRRQAKQAVDLADDWSCYAAHCHSPYCWSTNLKSTGVDDNHAISLQRQRSLLQRLLVAYQAVIHSDHHGDVGINTGVTNHIERFDVTMRQRVSRLVWLSLSFSK